MYKTSAVKQKRDLGQNVEANMLNFAAELDTVISPNMERTKDTGWCPYCGGAEIPLY